MTEAYLLQSSQNSLDWFCESVEKTNFSDQSLRSLKLYLNTNPSVHVDLANLNKVDYREGRMGGFLDVYEFNGSYYVVMK